MKTASIENRPSPRLAIAAALLAAPWLAACPGDPPDSPDGGTADGATADAGPLDGPPGVSITDPTSPVSREVTLVLELADTASDLADAELAYSVDGGPWRGLTAAAGSSLEGLTTSPSGETHLFVWASASDLPLRVENVVLRLLAWDDDGGSLPALTSPFVVDNDPGATNTAPSLTATAPVGVQSGLVPVPVVLVDAEADPVSLTLEVSTDRTFWAPMTLAASSPGLAALGATATGVTHVLLWDSLADLPQNRAAVWLRLTPGDGDLDGPSVEVGPITLRNAGAAAVGLRLTEVAVGNEDWLEIVNSGSDTVSVLDHRVFWTAGPTSAGQVTLPDIDLSPGERLVVTDGLAGAGEVTFGANVAWDFDFPGSAALVDPDGFGLDFVRWGGSAAPPPTATEWEEDSALAAPSGHAVLGRLVGPDTHRASDWCEMPASRFGIEPACLTASAGAMLRISELSLTDPDDAVEIVNLDTVEVDLTNWILRVWTGPTPQTVVLPQVVLAPGDRTALVDDASSAQALGLPQIPSGSLPWRPGESGAIALADPLGGEQDFLRWGGSTALPDDPADWVEGAPLLSPPTGVLGLSRDASDTDTDDAADWCIARNSWAAPNFDCVAAVTPGALMLNEIDAGSTDWVEVFNPGATAVDLAGSGLAYTDTASAAGTGFVDDFVLDPGARVQLRESTGVPSATTAFLGGNIPWSETTGGSATLLDLYGNPIDFVRWGGSTEPPPAPLSFTESAPAALIPIGGTLSRVPDGTDTDDASDWCITDATAAATNAACR